jgi:hypothetical protein
VILISARDEADYAELITELRELGGGDVVAAGLQALDDGAPA